MRFVLWGNGNRGVSCLETLLGAGYRPTLAVAHPQRGKKWYASMAEVAQRNDLSVIAPEDPNAPETIDRLRGEDADLFVLAGYGPILRQPVLDVPKRLTINLHGGRLPEYRGSSPMNWALINGDEFFSLSVIRVDAGVDTGDVLLERTFPIGPDDTIVELHKIANEAFPEMLLEVMREIDADKLRPRKQNPDDARYFPLRFPEDGLVMWDVLTAEEIHNRIRALRPPYPGAFTYYNGRKVILVASELREFEFRGEPGRVYRKTDEGLLVCAKDRCLWIREALFADDNAPLADTISRYDRLATVQAAAERLYLEGRSPC
ncbi:MAG: methionyl-tRNA formyltransferase [Phycisphaerae bacterium]|nr:methionyl-tRNA formyltransferase [Phycisphaerae bacterium]